jgi:hypothetical protein
MRHLKTILFLGCCFLIGMGIATAIVKWRANRAAYRLPDPPGGAPAVRGFYLPLNDGSVQALDGFASLHATSVAVTYPTSIANARESLKKTTARAHELGLKVMLLPPPVFAPANPYPAPLPAIAADAQAAKVDYLCISWLNAESPRSYWDTEATAVRRVFKGGIILAATPETLVGIDFLDVTDYLGAIGPFKIAQRLPHAPDNVDLRAVRIAWGGKIDELESVAFKTGKPVIFLNMALPVTNNPKLPLPDHPPTQTPNPAFQLMAYEGMLIETKGKKGLHGLMLPWSEAQGSTPLSAKISAHWADGTPPTAATSSSPSPIGESEPAQTMEADPVPADFE